MSLFADDAALLKSSRTRIEIEEMVNSDLFKLFSWTSQWLVTFSILKCKYLFVSNKKESDGSIPINIYLNETRLSEVSEHKCLGLTITNRLCWDKHINNLCNTANKRVGILKQVGRKLDFKTRAQVFKSFVLPCLEYGDVVYNSAEFKYSKRLNAIQRQAALFCTSAYRHTETKTLFRELGWMTLSDRREIHQLTLFFKIINRFTPKYLYNLLPPVQHNVVNTRQNPHSTPYKCRTEKFKKTYIPSLIIKWSKLAPYIINSTSINSFKRKLRNLYRVEPLHYFDECSGPGSVHHRRMRMGLSGLKHQRFTYNLVDNNICDTCGVDVENIHHFFFCCPTRLALSTELRHNLASLLSNRIIINSTKLVNCLLYGAGDNNVHDSNKDICHLLHTFIVKTKRFET